MASHSVNVNNNAQISISDLHKYRDALFKIGYANEDSAAQEIFKNIKYGCFSLAFSTSSQFLLNPSHYPANLVQKLRLIQQNCQPLANVIEKIRVQQLLGQHSVADKMTDELLKVVPESQEVINLKSEIEAELKQLSEKKEKEQTMHTEKFAPSNESLRFSVGKPGEPTRQFQETTHPEDINGTANAPFTLNVSAEKLSNLSIVTPVALRYVYDQNGKICVFTKPEIPADLQKQHIINLYNQGEHIKAGYLAASYRTFHQEDMDPRILKIVNVVR